MQEGWVSREYIVKSSKAKGKMLIQGYASVFDVVDEQKDILLKGAFSNAVPKKIKLLWQHDATKPIGVINYLEEDYYGLKMNAEINTKTTLGAEAAELIKQGALGGLSIGFSIKASDYSKKGTRLISDVDLKEISVVTFPANKEAEISQIKDSDDAQEKSIKELEEIINKLSTI